MIIWSSEEFFCCKARSVLRSYGESCMSFFAHYDETRKTRDHVICHAAWYLSILVGLFGLIRSSHVEASYCVWPAMNNKESTIRIVNTIQSLVNQCLIFLTPKFSTLTSHPNKKGQKSCSWFTCVWALAGIQSTVTTLLQSWNTFWTKSNEQFVDTNKD